MRNHLFRLVMAGLFGALPFCVSYPASAASITCATVAACIFGINTASGTGIEGESVSGLAVYGTSSSGVGVEGRSMTNVGVVGHTAVNPTSAGSGRAGVVGYDDSTNQMPYNAGVYGVSIYSTGVQGRSTNGPGVFALSYKGNGLVASSGAVLYSGFTNTGVFGQSVKGPGVIGVGRDTGVSGFQTNDCYSGYGEPGGCQSPLQKEIPSGAAITAGTDNAGLGLKIVTDTNPNLNLYGYGGVGATISAALVGMQIDMNPTSGTATGLVINGAGPSKEGGDMTANGAIISGFNAVTVTDIGGGYGLAVSGNPAIVSQPTYGGYAFEGRSSTGTPTSALDGSGNLIIAGKLTQNGTITGQLRNADGTASAAYGTRSTVPTVEDLGEANLLSGTAYVTIDAALRKSVDIARGYLVFLTPEGPTSGLYVTGRSPAGFSVHEIGGARDTIAFDYRIVARPYGETGERLAPMSMKIRSQAGAAQFYRHLKPLRFNHGRVDRTSLPVASR